MNNDPSSKELTASVSSDTQESLKPSAISTAATTATTASLSSSANRTMMMSHRQDEIDTSVAAASSQAATGTSTPSSIAPQEAQEAAKCEAATIPGLRDYDVLTGRGSGPNQSQGNTRFRQVVWETYQDYVMSLQSKTEDAASSSRQPQPQQQHIPMDSGIKNRLAGQILGKMQDLNGRFLRRISPEDFRNLPEVERAKVIQVPPEALSSKGDSSTPPRKRATFFVQLTAKETMEKIKQSLRFQIDRSEQQKEHQRQRDQLQQQAVREDNAKKRKAVDEALLQSIVGGLNNSPTRPAAKRLAAPFGLLGRAGLHGQSFLSGLPPTASAAPSDAAMKAAAMKAGQAEMIGKLLQEGGAAAGQHRQPLAGFDSAVMDFSTWPPSTRARAASIDLASVGSQRSRTASMDLSMAQRPSPAAGSLFEAAASLQRLQQEQAREALSLEALTALRRQRPSEPPSEPATPSSFRSTTQLEALSRLLLQEQLNAGLEAQIRRNQEMSMDSPLLQRHQLGPSTAAGMLGGNLRVLTPSLSSSPGSNMLEALLAAHASKRQSLPTVNESPGSALAASSERASLPGSTMSTLPTNDGIASFLARLQQTNAASRSAFSSSPAVAKPQSQQLPPSLLPIAAKQPDTDSPSHQGN